MKLCTSCDAQFPDDLARCIHCGRNLDPPPRQSDPPESERTVPEDMVLYRKREPIYAPPLLDALRAAGVRFMAVGDMGQWKPKAAEGNSGRDSKIEIYVDREHLERAYLVETELLRRTLPDLASGPIPAPMKGDHCPACDTQLEIDQMTCPGCGLHFA